MGATRLLRRTGSRTRMAAYDKLTPLQPDPIFVLGNQKSGTTAVARLLATAIGRSYSHDMFYRRGWDDVEDLHRGRIGVDDLVRRSRWEFSRGVVKDPDLTFHLESLRSRFPRARFVFVVRHPADNVRSLLNRHGIDGSRGDLEPWEVEAFSPLWRSVFTPGALGLVGGTYIEVLAQRWAKAAEVLLTHSDAVRVVPYEQFLCNKRQVVEHLAEDLGETVTTDISGSMDVQFQPRGDHSVSSRDFFGECNWSRLERWTGGAAAALGYRF